MLSPKKQTVSPSLKTSASVTQLSRNTAIKDSARFIRALRKTGLTPRTPYREFILPCYSFPVDTKGLVSDSPERGSRVRSEITRFCAATLKLISHGKNKDVYTIV